MFRVGDRCSILYSEGMRESFTHTIGRTVLTFEPAGDEAGTLVVYRLVATPVRLGEVFQQGGKWFARVDDPVPARTPTEAATDLFTGDDRTWG